MHVILLSSNRSYMASIPTLLSMAAAEFTLPGSTESSLQKSEAEMSIYLPGS